MSVQSEWLVVLDVESERRCRTCRWFGVIDACLPMHGVCRRHMKTVHMNFVCDEWEPLWEELE